MPRWLRWPLRIIAVDALAVCGVIAWAGADYYVHVWRPAHR